MEICNSLKKCSTCLKNYPHSFFYKSDSCCGCIYRQKLRNTKQKSKCKLCHKELPTNRWKYCSPECANKANAINKKSWWVYHAKAEKIYWKNL